ncbi:MAG: hypothetical protein HKL90_03070 [Elusimicrobia bacterium]|nr:hypothetical protein [Elusimicrobiota bacterium]
MGLKGAARFAGTAALVLFLCWQHVQATRLGYRVESARREAAQRRGRVESLRLDLERRLSPQQVAARAARLGMVPADPRALRRLEDRPRQRLGSAPVWGLLTRTWTPLPARG